VEKVKSLEVRFCFSEFALPSPLLSDNIGLWNYCIQTWSSTIVWNFSKTLNDIKAWLWLVYLFLYIYRNYPGLGNNDSPLPVLHVVSLEVNDTINIFTYIYWFNKTMHQCGLILGSFFPWNSYMFLSPLLFLIFKSVD
jgi:hypothetical protein